MSSKLGLDCVLHRNTGSYGTPVWNDVPNVKDLTLSMEKSEADVTTRASGGWRWTIGTLKDGTIEFQMVADSTDDDFTAIQSAFFANTPIEFANTDPNSPGDPTTWKQAIVNAKNGDEKAAVVLGLVGDNGLPGAICTNQLAEASPRLRQFADSFTYGSWGSICSLDYTPFFHDAVTVVDSACDDFTPPG